MYVAISRARARKYINFCDVDCQLQEGYIYIIVNQLTNKLYIGSTKTSIEQRFDEHVKCLDGSPLHSAIQELGHENFKIELVEKVPYIDEEQLLIAETANIIKFNSIEAGYNTKLSVSLENLY
jgi:group I intron endonuclease